MKKLKLLLYFFFIVCCEFTFSQNYVVYSPLLQSKNTNSGVETTATVVATCYGSAANSVLINPTYCAWDNGLLGITFSNGTYLLPGQISTITFRFKKTVTANQTFEYKFSTNGSCLNPQIKITVNYNYVAPPPTTCTIPAPTGAIISNIQTNSVTCSWNSVPGAASYMLQFTGLSHPSIYTTSTSQVINSLNSGRSYTVNIIPLCSNGINTGNWSTLNFTTVCSPYSSPPANITATPSGSGYKINFTYIPNYYGYYIIDYIDLSNNSSGSQTIYNGDFFYYVSPPKSFQFRIRPSGCSAPSSDWITIVPFSCSINNYPSSLSFSTQSVCGGTPGHCCGYGQFSWSTVSEAVNYQIEYMGVNLTNAAVPSVSGTFQSTSINTAQPTQYACNSNQAGIWILKYRVRSQCSNGTWSDFSPWSANFAW